MEFDSKPIAFYFIKLLNIILEKWKFHVKLVSTVTLITVIILLCVKNFYSSTAIVYPPPSSQANQFSDLVGSNQALMSFAGIGNLAKNKNSDLCIAISESPIFSRNIIKKFDLINYYKFKKKYKIEEVIEKFRENFGVVEDDLGNLQVTFESKSPELCSLVVAYATKNLDSTFIYIQQQRAIKEQAFVSGKIFETKSKLDSLVDEMIHFQISNSIYLPMIQMEGTIEQLLELEKSNLQLDGQKSLTKEIEGANSSNLRKMEISGKILNEQIKKLTTGQTKNNSLLTGIEKSPRLIVDFKKKEAEIDLQIKMFGFFKKYYEELKLRGTSNFEQIQILSPGYIPQKKKGPPKTIIVLLVFSIANILSILSLSIRYFLIEDKEKNGVIWTELSKINLFKINSRKK